jgi:hypothetical protein
MNLRARDFQDGDVFLYEGRRIRVTQTTDFGDHVTITGRDIAARRKFVLHCYNTLGVFTIETRKP